MELVVIDRKDRRRCRHMIPMSQTNCCAAGVNYDAVRKGGPPVQYRYRDDRSGPPFTAHSSVPCIVKYNLHGATCDKCEYPGPEDLAAEEAEMKADMEKVDAARAAIVAHLGAWRKGISPSARGKIDCPACGCQEALHFQRAGYNGHIHACCETRGCVSWTE